MSNKHRLEEYLKDTDSNSYINLFTKLKEKGILTDYANAQIQELSYTWFYEYKTRYLKARYIAFFEDFADMDSASKTRATTTLANTLWARFGQNWQSIWNAYSAEYNPLENYSISQESSFENTQNVSAKTQTDGTYSEATKNSVYPFNDELTPVSEASSNGTDSQTATRSKADNETSGKGTESLSRHGRFKQSAQELLKQELELRNLDFEKRLFDDIAKHLFRDYIGTDCDFDF